MSLEDFSSSPRVDPRIAWAWIVGMPGILVVPLVAPALIYGEHLGAVDLLISMAWCSGLGRLQGIRELFAQNGVPCLWYRRLGGMETEAASDGTQEPFGVRDETGYAIVLPYHAYVEAVRRHTLNDGEGRVYVEDRIYAGDKLYILGEFTSSEPSFDLEKAVANKLLQWREDPHALLAQFDANRDGHIDAQEDWKMRVQALHAAQAEGEAAIAQYRAVNLIKSPEDGRAFIISTRPRGSFNRRLRAWELLGLAAFIAGIFGAGYLGIQLLSRALI